MPRAKFRADPLKIVALHKEQRTDTATFSVLCIQDLIKMSDVLLLAGDHALHCLFMSSDILVRCYGDIATA